MDFFYSKIINFLLVYFFIFNYNVFLSVIMHCLIYNNIRNINIILTSKYIKINIKQNRFINFFIKNNATYISTKNLIFDICYYLNNFIPEFFKKLIFF